MEISWNRVRSYLYYQHLHLLATRSISSQYYVVFGLGHDLDAAFLRTRTSPHQQMQDKMTVSSLHRGRIFNEGKMGLYLWGCQHADAQSVCYRRVSIARFPPQPDSDDMEKSVDTTTSNNDDINSEDKRFRNQQGVKWVMAVLLIISPLNAFECRLDEGRKNWLSPYAVIVNAVYDQYAPRKPMQYQYGGAEYYTVVSSRRFCWYAFLYSALFSFQFSLQFDVSTSCCNQPRPRSPNLPDTATKCGSESDEAHGTSARGS